MMSSLSKLTDEEKFKEIKELTCEVLNIDERLIESKSRKAYIQLPRLIAVNIARIEHMLCHRILAKGINRDRSLIYHYENIHEGNYASWEKYRDCFNRVYNAYTNHKEAKLEFDDARTIKRHLLEFFDEDKVYQIKILITSGKVGCTIKSNYNNFSKILKSIKFALKNYNYSLEIQLA